MLQLSQVLLPVDHRDDDLRSAVLKMLGARDDEVIAFRSSNARLMRGEGMWSSVSRCWSR
jgi:hypothetical protein